MGIYWYFFGDPFYIVASKHCKRVEQSSLIFDWGIGYNIKHLRDKVLFIIWELNGDFNPPNLICKKKNPNSSGAIIYSGPLHLNKS